MVAVSVDGVDVLVLVVCIASEVVVCWRCAEVMDSDVTSVWCLCGDSLLVCLCVSVDFRVASGALCEVDEDIRRVVRWCVTVCHYLDWSGEDFVEVVCVVEANVVRDVTWLVCGRLRLGLCAFCLSYLRL